MRYLVGLPFHIRQTVDIFQASNCLRLSFIITLDCFNGCEFKHGYSLNRLWIYASNFE